MDAWWKFSLEHFGTGEQCLSEITRDTPGCFKLYLENSAGWNWDQFSQWERTNHITECISVLWGEDPFLFSEVVYIDRQKTVPLKKKNFLVRMSKLSKRTRESCGAHRVERVCGLRGIWQVEKVLLMRGGRNEKLQLDTIFHVSQGCAW